MIAKEKKQEIIAKYGRTAKMCIRDRDRGIEMTNFDVYLADAKTVAIAGHVRPDGDCAGSCLATYNYIKNYFPHVKVDLYLEPIPNIFKFMKRSEEILSEWPDDRKYDLFIAQDCGCLLYTSGEGTGDQNLPCD